MGEARRRNPNVTLAVLLFAITTFSFQQSMVFPVLAELRDDLHTTTEWVTWVLSGFALAGGVTMPLAGKLGDQFGRKRMLVGAIACFCLGSAGAAAAPDIWTLIACRGVQGLGGAMIPLTFSILRDELPQERLGVAFGAVSSSLVTASTFGIVLAGVIVDALSWRYLFVFGAVGLAVSGAFVYALVPESSIKTRTRTDFLGAALLSSGIAALLLALTEGAHWGWTSPGITSLLGVTLVTLVVWVRVELTTSEPMVDVRMFARRGVVLASIGMAAGGAGAVVMWGIVPLFAYTERMLPGAGGPTGYGFGASLTSIGFYLIPALLCGAPAGVVTGFVARRLGPSIPLAAGCGITALGFVALALWHDHPWQLIVALIPIQVGLTSAGSACPMLIVASVPPEETGVASGVNQVMRMIGHSVAGQAAAAVLSTYTIATFDVATEAAYVVVFVATGAVSALAAFAAVTLGRRPSRTLVPAGMAE